MLSRLLTSGEFYSVACSAVWALSVILFRKAGESVSPVALNFFKDCIALVLFLATLPVLGLSLTTNRYGAGDWLVLLASGAIGIGIADTVFFASLNRLGAVGTSIVNSLYSPFVVLFAFLYLREPVGATLLAGAALMMLAILVGTWEPPQAGERQDRRRLVEGAALGVLSMALMALAIVLCKPVLDRVEPWWAATVRCLGGVAFLVLQGLVSRDRRVLISCFRPCS